MVREYVVYYKQFEPPKLESGRLSNTKLCVKCTEKAYHKAHFGICTVCGKEFEYPVVNGYVSKHKVCSPECRKKLEYKSKRQN